MKRTIAILVSLAVLTIMLLPTSVKAAPDSALVRISTDNSNVEVGDTVNITVSQYEAGGEQLNKSKYVEFELTYDKEIFEYQQVPEGFNGQKTDGMIKVTTNPPHGTADISSVTLTFKALKATNKSAFTVSNFKYGDDSGNTQTASYNVKSINVKVREKYEGTVSIQADKTSIPVERKVNISLAQTTPTNYVEAIVSYDKAHFEFIGPANESYEANETEDGKITVKASGTDITDVTLLFKGIAETEENSKSWFTIESYKAGSDSEEAGSAHFYSSKAVSVSVTPRNNSMVEIKTDLIDNTAKVGDAFIVTVSQDKPTDYLQFDLFYNQDVLGYIDLGSNDADVITTSEDNMLSVSATGSQISEINLVFKALKLTDETNNGYITVSNFLSGDNAGDTDEADYSIQRVDIKVLETEPELPIDELPATGSIIPTLMAEIIALVTAGVIVSKKSR